MPKVRLADGSLVDVGLDALFADDGQTALNIPTGPVFTADDLERVRQEEKDKLYGRIDTLTSTITSLNEQVGGLTAEQQRQKAEAEQERARLAEEARRQEEQGLDAATLVERARNEWQQTLSQKEQEWNSRFEQEAEQRRAAEAVAQREREFGELRDYTLSQVAAHENEIAPQLRQWISGNTKEEVDASIARAIETTNQIAAEMQQALGGQVPGQEPANQQFAAVPGAQPVPPVVPGTRATGGPGNSDPAAGFQQQLTAEQIANMPMDQYAKLRGQMGIGGQSNNRGLFG